MTEHIFTLGMDIGSTASKCVIMKNGREIAAQSVVPLGTGTSGPERSLEGVLKESGLSQEDIALTAATGYGRNSIPQAKLSFSELSCHAKGACWLFPAVRTVIDIGGQDVKALTILNGRLDQFVMNDKCAAGTGRFLEVMAHVLDKELSEMPELDARSKNRVDISSTCTVFAESEVISQLAQGVDICDLVAGIHRSVARRAASLVKRLGIIEPLFLTGGVAQNSGVVRALEKELGLTVRTDPRAQLAGAIGAALLAWEQIREEE